MHDLLSLATALICTGYTTFEGASSDFIGEKSNMMLALVIAKKTYLNQIFITELSRQGYRIVHFTDPVRGLDCLYEIEPDTVMIDIARYPEAIELAKGILSSSGKGGNCTIGNLSTVQDPALVQKSMIESQNTALPNISLAYGAEILICLPKNPSLEVQDDLSLPASKPSAGLLIKASEHRNI